MLAVKFLTLLVSPICASLGGKAIRDLANNQRLLDIDNYAYVTICGHESHGNPNITVFLTSSNNETNAFHISKYNIAEEFDMTTHIENVVAIEIRAYPNPEEKHRFNPKRITIHYDDQFFKLHLNAQCSQSSNFWTSVDQTTVWSKKIDCQSSSVICDDNTDVLIANPGTGMRMRNQCPIGTLPPITNVIFRNGITKYQFT